MANDNFQYRVKSPKFLMFEDTGRPVEIIKENLTKNQKAYYIEGIYGQAEIRNQNGRIYPFYLMDREVRIMQDNIANGFRCTGELDHPEYIEIKLNNAAHNMKELRRDGDSKKYFYGKSKILNPEIFPSAKKVIGLIEEGIKFGVSTRGIGDMDSSGTVTEYQLITVDIVADPSAQASVVEAIYESKDSFLRKNIITLEQYDQINNSIKNNKNYKNIMSDVQSYFKAFIRGN